MALIRLVSDIHIEFGNFHLPELSTDSDSALILAGDIGTQRMFIDNGHSQSVLEFLYEVKNRFRAVYWVAGNHDYWGGNVKRGRELYASVCEKFSNVHFLDNSSSYFRGYDGIGVNIIGATLWTDFDKGNKDLIARAPYVMNDYRFMSKYNGKTKSERNMTGEDIYREHKKSISYIKRELKRFKEEKEDCKTIVVSHHCPSVKSVHSRYAKESTNNYYYSDLEPVMEKYEPVLWAHGHTHHNFDYIVGKTRVVCNPRGYHGREVNRDFNPELVLEV